MTPEGIKSKVGYLNEDSSKENSNLEFLLLNTSHLSTNLRN